MFPINLTKTSEIENETCTLQQSSFHSINFLNQLAALYYYMVLVIMLPLRSFECEHNLYWLREVNNQQVYTNNLPSTKKSLDSKLLLHPPPPIFHKKFRVALTITSTLYHDHDRRSQIRIIISSLRCAQRTSVVCLEDYLHEIHQFFPLCHHKKYSFYDLWTSSFGFLVVMIMALSSCTIANL